MECTLKFVSMGHGVYTGVHSMGLGKLIVHGPWSVHSLLKVQISHDPWSVH